MNSCTVMVKPASSRCNFDCDYCFYRETAHARREPDRGIMSQKTASALLERLSEYCPAGSAVNFVFQGGEPLLAGLSFYESFIKNARERLAAREISFCLQTNGSLLTDESCAFFKAQGFLVGLSLDGRASTNDRHRRLPCGDGTHAAVMKAVRLLKKHGVDFNILTVITDELCEKPKQFFGFLMTNGFDFVQLIPCMPPKTGKAPLTPEKYGEFLKRIFTLWQKNDCKPEIRYFQNLSAMLNGQPPEQCGANGRCTPQLTVEADGSVYPCDFYAEDRFFCGNVSVNTIDEIARSSGIADFLAEKTEPNSLCSTCRYISICGSGCKRSRPMLNAKKGYCPQKDFFEFAIGRHNK